VSISCWLLVVGLKFPFRIFLKMSSAIWDKLEES